MGIVIGKTYRFKTYSARDIDYYSDSDTGYRVVAVTVTGYVKRPGMRDLVHYVMPNGKPGQMYAGTFKGRIS